MNSELIKAIQFGKTGSRILCKNTIKTTIQHQSRCVQAVIRFAGLELGLVLDIYCLMSYAYTKRNWVVFAAE